MLLEWFLLSAIGSWKSLPIRHWSCLWGKTLLKRSLNILPMCWCYLCWCRTTASPFPLTRMERGGVVWCLEHRPWWALASSCAFPLNGVACTMLMRLSLSSNSRLLVLSVGPVRMFSVLGAENSRRVFSAIASRTGVEPPFDWFDCEKIIGESQPILQYPI